MKYKSCQYIEGGLTFQNHGITVCCAVRNAPNWHMLIDSYSNEQPFPIDDIMSKRQRIIEAHKKEQYLSTCNGCRNLVESDYIEKEFPFDVISIQNDLRCNLRCIYCNFIVKWEDNGMFDHINAAYQIYPIIKELLEKKLISPTAQIFMAGGEPTLIKSFTTCLRDLFTYSSDIKVQIATNATYVPEGMIDICKEYGKQITILTSLDSGSKEIYSHVKGKDLFDKVSENLAIYQKYVANVKLKMILLDQNISDIENFHKLAKDLGVADVICDIDCTQDMHNIPLNILNGIAQFMWESHCHKTNPTYGSAWEFYDITKDYIDCTKNIYFDDRIANIEGGSFNPIKLSIIGKNAQAYANEAIIYNFGSTKQPIWVSADKLKGIFVNRPDITASRTLIILSNVEDYLTFDHSIAAGQSLFIQLQMSKWSGILRIEVLGKVHDIDLFSEVSTVTTLQIDL